MRRRSTQRRLGLALMATALVGALVAGAPALAQGGEASTVETPVQAKALIAYPLNDVVPDTLLKGFPPQVVCVVRPDLCPEEVEPVREPIGDALGEVDANQQTSPLQPANPDGLTVTFTGGTPRYGSAVKVQLPTVPAGEEIDEFVLSLPQGQPSFSFDSPAFRRIVMGIIQTAGAQDPAVFQEHLRKALEDEEPFTEPLLGIEACPLTRAIPEDAEAPRSAPVSAISQENADGQLEPALDCLYGSNGSFADGTWTFDLTFAAKAWADGTLEYHGIFLRPTGAPNLAFGDPDTSTNAQVVLDVSQTPKATFATSEPPPPPAPLAPLPPPTTTTSAPTTSAPASTTSTVSTPPSSQMFSSAPVSSGTATPTTPPAEVAPPQTAPAAPQSQPVALDAAPASEPSTPWSVWLLLVPFAGGAVLTARSLGGELVVGGGSRGGALTRLVEATPSTG